MGNQLDDGLPASRVDLALELLAERFAVARLAPGAAAPAWAEGGALLSVTRTPSELSIVCAEALVPPDVEAERGFRCLEVAGPLDFAATGVLSSLAAPLAMSGISIFTLSTYDTDYLFLPEKQLEAGLGVLAGAGHTIRR